ncbi:hypothetical protein [Streptomyces sp. Sce081]|uniref:hypothetical protein n=1 Tax=Streptomyces sp. Sce081 TaxID=3349853 RepID=UPI0035F3B44C
MVEQDGLVHGKPMGAEPAAVQELHDEADRRANARFLGRFARCGFLTGLTRGNAPPDATP